MLFDKISPDLCTVSLNFLYFNFTIIKMGTLKVSYRKINYWVLSVTPYGRIINDYVYKDLHFQHGEIDSEESEMRSLQY